MSSIFNPPISAKENYLRAVKHQRPVWIPMRSDSLNFTPRIYPDNVARAFVLDGRPYNGPVGGPDIFGVVWKYIPVAGGSMVEPGRPFLRSIEEWHDKVRFPDLDSWDWAASAEACREYLNSDKLVSAWVFNGLFERLISFLDFEDAAVAMIDEDQQDEAKALFQALTDFYKKLIDKYVQYYAIDVIHFHDDWGSQRSPFFSLTTCREMLVPYLKQIVDHCHSKGKIFELHSCGKIEALVPAMVEWGVDTWGGQPMNDKKMLYDLYGDKILLGINGPFGPDNPPPEDEQELRRQLNAFLEPYAPHLKEKQFYLIDVANFQSSDRIREAFYQCSSKLLGGAE